MSQSQSMQRKVFGAERLSLVSRFLIFFAVEYIKLHVIRFIHLGHQTEEQPLEIIIDFTNLKCCYLLKWWPNPIPQNEWAVDLVNKNNDVTTRFDKNNSFPLSLSLLHFIYLFIIFYILFLNVSQTLIRKGQRIEVFNSNLTRLTYVIFNLINYYRQPFSKTCVFGLETL